MVRKSEENWRVGNQCLEAGDVNVAASRLYYAVLQAILAWAHVRKANVPQHEVHSYAGRLVATEGKGRRLYGPLFAELRSWRETADYQPDSPPVDELKESLRLLDDIRNQYIRMAQSQ